MLKLTLMREPNRMSMKDASTLQRHIEQGSGAAARYTWQQWEAKARGLLRIAVTTYGNAPEPTPTQLKSGKLPLPPDAGWWRDKDRRTPEENKRRMPGQLDYVYWRVYYLPEDVPKTLQACLPWSKVEPFMTRLHDGTPASFDLHIECKTGNAVPNPQQERTIRRVSFNPGAHAFVVYPHDLAWLRKVLGL